MKVRSGIALIESELTCVVHDRMSVFIDTLSKMGFEVHVIFDGPEETVKEDTNDARYRERIRSMRCWLTNLTADLVLIHVATLP